MTFEAIKKACLSVRIFRSGGLYAPHKPLLLLLILTQFYTDKKRSWLYESIHDKMVELLKQFSPYTDSYQPNYPFIKLANDGIWKISADENINTTAEYSAVRLISLHAQGEFKDEINEILNNYYNRIPDLIEAILSEFFPENLHGEIMNMVGFTEMTIVRSRQRRDPAFRAEVLRTYGYRCAVCGLGARLGDTLVGLEAAHIKWFQANGPDKITNGVALCSMHHKLFDRGAYAFTNDHHLVASSLIHDGNQLEELLFRYEGKRIRLPLNPNELPEPEYINWHWKNIFKRPIRYFNRLEEMDIAAEFL